MITTKDVQGQKAIGIVVAVEEPSFLEAMYPVIRSIEVEDQLFGRFGKGGNELLHQHLMNGEPPPHGPCGSPNDTRSVSYPTPDPARSLPVTPGRLGAGHGR